MILYKDNPNLKAPVITTFKGDREYRKNCKYIKGTYYVKERDCFEMPDGKWYRVNSGKITLDHETKKWVLNNTPNLKKGIVGFDGKGQPIIGNFTGNIYKNTHVIVDNQEYDCIDYSLLLNNGFFEDVARGTFYRRSSVTNSTFTKMTTIRNEKTFTHKGYNIEDNAVEFKEKQKSYKEYPCKPTRAAMQYGNLLGDVTYGFEVETSAGNLPDFVQNRAGIVACRDGSINSAEYVTVPMHGAKGLENIVFLSEMLKPRCNIDMGCSFHIHIGGLPISKDFIVAVYTLAYKLQDDIFKMFPYYKTEPGQHKRKNYNQKLEKKGINSLKDSSKEGYKSFIEDAYRKIFIFLSGGEEPSGDFNKRKKKHPIAHKWNRESRYYWINLINMIFSERETVEFRFKFRPLI